jgi:hypothetical protein
MTKRSGNRLGRCDVLEYLIEEEGCKKFAEIGVFRSYLCRVLLRRPVGYLLEEYWAIDPWDMMTGKYDGDKVAKERWDRSIEAKADEEQWYLMYRYCCRLMSYFPQLRVVKMASKQASTLFPDGYFDIVFIDAIHIYEYVYADIGYWLPKVRKGGFLCGHDYGHSSFSGVTKAVDKYFNKDIKVYDHMVWAKRI